MKKLLVCLLIIIVNNPSFGQSAYSKPHNYDQPVYKPDFQLIERSMSTKQSAYDRNYNAVISKMNEISSIHKIAYKLGVINTTSRAQYMKSFVDDLVIILNSDLSKPSVFNAAIQYLNSVQSEITTWITK